MSYNYREGSEQGKTVRAGQLLFKKVEHPLPVNPDTPINPDTPSIVVVQALESLENRVFGITDVLFERLVGIVYPGEEEIVPSKIPEDLPKPFPPLFNVYLGHVYCINEKLNQLERLLNRLGV